VAKKGKMVQGIFFCDGFRRAVKSPPGPNRRFKEYMRENWNKVGFPGSAGLEFDNCYFCACGTDKEGRTTAIFYGRILDENKKAPYDAYFFGYPTRRQDESEEWHPTRINHKKLLKMYFEKMLKQHGEWKAAGIKSSDDFLENRDKITVNLARTRINVGRTDMTTLKEV